MSRTIGAETGDGTTQRHRSSVTIGDVAAAVGMSPSAVSRALNKPGRMAPETEQRIRKVALELGYRINPMARALQTGRTQMIAVMVSDITNPIYANVIRGLESVTEERDQTLIYAESHESPDREVAAVDRLLPVVDGVILVAPRADDDAIRRLAAIKPVVVVNRQLPGIPSIVPDVVPGLTQAVDHLAELGHVRIGYVSGPASSWMSARRWDALSTAATARTLEMVEIGPNAPTFPGGAESLDRIRESGVTAVVAYNDLVAVGINNRAHAAGVEVPRDLSVIGFDDAPGMAMSTPPLTTVHSPLAEAGAAAIRRLLEEIDGVEPGPVPAMTTTLVVRSSTAAPAVGDSRT